MQANVAKSLYIGGPAFELFRAMLGILVHDDPNAPVALSRLDQPAVCVELPIQRYNGSITHISGYRA